MERFEDAPVTRYATIDAERCIFFTALSCDGAGLSNQVNLMKASW
jgi:hypothetical protein